MPTLVIRHLDCDSDPYCFCVEQPERNQRTGPATLTPPSDSLNAELRWYLEKFLAAPLRLQTEAAQASRMALTNWGRQTLQTLFAEQTGQSPDVEITGDVAGSSTLIITSDRPAVLAWPWEVLGDCMADGPARRWRIERRLNRLPPYPPVSDRLPRERINLLLISTRPYVHERGFRVLSHLLPALIDEHRLPLCCDLLYPPTFARLQQMLQARPDYYHVVHFDGDCVPAAQNEPAADGNGDGDGDTQPCLLFETQQAAADPIDAQSFAGLLRAQRVPLVLLSSGASTLAGARTATMFAAVAAGLQRAGIAGVAVLPYALYEDGARLFLEHFYRQLFASGDIAAALDQARQALRRQQLRLCCSGSYPLDDWLVPVLYRQEAAALDFTGVAGSARTALSSTPLPEEVLEEDDCPLFGRDSELQQLQRLLRRPVAGILLHGPAGIGKTLLLKGLLRRLAAHGRLSQRPFWFTFDGILGSDYLLNQMAGRLFGSQSIMTDSEQKLAVLIPALKKHPFLIVLDRFELLGEADSGRGRLQHLLMQLHGGHSKIIMLSRRQEDWLSAGHCSRLLLDGLCGEQRWRYCDALLTRLAAPLLRQSSGFAELAGRLSGAPLGLRVILAQAAAAGDQNHALAALGDTLQRRLQESQRNPPGPDLFDLLDLLQQRLPASQRTLLIVLALHRRYLDARLLEMMVRSSGVATEPDAPDRLLNHLVDAGLLHHNGQDIYTLHPALSDFLSARLAPDDPAIVLWQRVFVEVMSRHAEPDPVASRQQQRTLVQRHAGNFHSALAAASALGMALQRAVLTRALATYAHTQLDFISARRYLEQLAECGRTTADADTQIYAYYRLGRIAQQSSAHGAAGHYYEKVLALTENHNGQALLADTFKLIANTCHQLGRMAEQRQDLSAAAHWYRRSMSGVDRADDSQTSVQNLQRQIRTAVLPRRVAAFRTRLPESQKIQQEDGGSALHCYRQLRQLAEENGDVAAAVQWQQRIALIKQREHDEQHALMSYHRLAHIAETVQNFTAAAHWYRRAWAIWRPRNDPQRIASIRRWFDGLLERENKNNPAGSTGKPASSGGTADELMLHPRSVND